MHDNNLYNTGGDAFPCLLLKYSATSAPSVQHASESLFFFLKAEILNTKLISSGQIVHCDFILTLMLFNFVFRTAFKIQLPQMVKPKKKKLKQAT